MAWVLAIVTAYFLWESFGLSGVASLIPRFVLSLTLVLLIIELALLWSTGRRPQAEATGARDARKGLAGHTGLATPPWRTIAWIALLPATIWLLGLIAGATAFCLIFLKGHGKETWKFSLAVSLSLGVLLNLIFSVVFQSRLYPGVIGFLT